MNIFEQKQRKVLVQKEILFIACIILGLNAACNDINNREIYFIHYFPEQPHKTLCVYSQDSISVLDTIFYSNIGEFYRINNKKYSYIEPGGLHQFLITPSLIIRDFAHFRSDTIEIDNTDPGWMVYTISNRIYIVSESRNIFYIYVYDGNILRKCFEFKPYPDSCILDINRAYVSDGGNVIAITCDITVWPSPLNWNPEWDQEYLIVKLEIPEYNRIPAEDILRESAVIFENDTTFYAITGSNIYKYNVNGDKTIVYGNIDSSASYRGILGYFENRYLVSNEIFIDYNSTSTFYEYEMNLFYLDSYLHYDRIEIDSGVIGFQYSFDIHNSDLLYTKKDRAEDPHSKLLAYSFGSGQIDTIFTIEGELYDPQVAYR